MSFLPNQAAAAVVLREAILACYRSGQMSAAQWERHCEDDPELRTMVEAPCAMTDPIAAIREALKKVIAATGDYLPPDGISKDECLNRILAATDNPIINHAIAAYDAAAAPSRQSADVEAMARELAKRASSGDTLAQSRIEGRVLSFAAHVAADQRERDAKIAETPDQQRANKTAAQIAAAIRTQGESE